MIINDYDIKNIFVTRPYSVATKSSIRELTTILLALGLEMVS